MNDQTKNRIREICQSNPTEESCGLIVEVGREERVVPCRNVAQNRTESWSIHRKDYTRASLSGKILATFHSHVSGNDFSEWDIAICNGHRTPSVLYRLPTDDFLVLEPEHNLPFSSYLGRKFELGKTDCFSLVRDYYRRELGIEILNYDRSESWYKADPKKIENAAALEGFFLDAPENRQQNDILIFKENGICRHFGIYLGSGRVLHHPRNRPSCIQNLEDVGILAYAARKTSRN